MKKMSKLDILRKNLIKKRPDLLGVLVDVGVTEDGRRLDHTAANLNGEVVVGPAGDKAAFPLYSASYLMTLLTDEYRYFRGPAAGEGGASRLKIVRFEKTTLADFLGIKEADLKAA